MAFEHLTLQGLEQAVSDTNHRVQTALENNNEAAAIDLMARKKLLQETLNKRSHYEME